MLPSLHLSKDERAWLLSEAHQFLGATYNFMVKMIHHLSYLLRDQADFQVQVYLFTYSLHHQSLKSYETWKKKDSLAFQVLTWCIHAALLTGVRVGYHHHLRHSNHHNHSPPLQCQRNPGQQAQHHSLIHALRIKPTYNATPWFRLQVNSRRATSQCRVTEHVA